MDVIQPFLAVLFVLGLLCGALWFLRNRGVAAFQLQRSPTGTRQMEVLERISLGPQQALHLVRVGQRCMVVATGQGGSCQVLLEMEKQ